MRSRVWVGFAHFAEGDFLFAHASLLKRRGELSRGQHPRQIPFIFASSFEFSTASTSASGVWFGGLDPEAAWSGGAEILDPGRFACCPTQAGVALSRQA